MSIFVMKRNIFEDLFQETAHHTMLHYTGFQPVEHPVSASMSTIYIGLCGTQTIKTFKVFIPALP